MAQKRVENKELFSPDAFSKTTEDVKLLIKQLDKLEESLKTVAKEQVKTLKGSNNKSTKDLERQKEAIKKVNAAERTAQTIRKQKLSLQQRLKVANSDAVQSNVRLNEQLKQQNRINRQIERETQKVFGAYTNLSTRLIRLRKNYKDLAAAEKGNTAEAKKLLREITKLDGKLKSIDKTVGQTQRNVGNYTSAFSRLGTTVRSTLTAFGLTGGLFAFARGIREGFNTIRDFQKENAVLAGVLNQTREQTKILTTDAQRLGSTTAKTATEVTKLQIAYARLGFSQSEILDVTEGTIAGSIALNGSLDETAELTGAVIRTFDDFKAADSAEILDVLTAATQKSALNFERLQASLPIVSGAANAAGIPFTRLVSLLGKLADSGIDASSSATAIRNIFIESAAQGLNYEEILDKIANNTDKLTAANDEFGKRAAVSASVLANNIAKTNELDEALQNVAGTAQRVADEQLDTLDGEILLLTSAYEGFILSVESGDGKISKAIKSVVSSFTELLGTLTTLNQTVESFGAGAEKGESSFVKRIIGSTDDTDQVFLRLKAEIFKAEKQLKDIVKRREDIGFLELLTPQGLANKKTQEFLEGTTRKRLELLNKALENPSKFLEVQDPIVTGGNGDGDGTDDQIKRRERLVELTRNEKTELDALKDTLKIVNDRREDLVTKTDVDSKKTFTALTDEAKALERLIKAYEDILNGKTGPQASDAQPQKAPDITGNIFDNIDKKKEALEELKGLIADTLNGIGTLVQDAFENRLQNVSEELQRIQNTTNQLINKANQSRLSSEESIAFERKKEAEALQTQQRLRKQQQQAEILFTIIQSYQSAVANGSSNPISQTVRDVGILRTLASSFGSAYDGVDDTGGRGQIDSKGGKLWVLHPREQVWSEKNRSEVGYKTREEIIDIVKSSESGRLTNEVVLSDLKRSSRATGKTGLMTDKNIVSKLDSLNKSIKEIELKSDAIDIDSVRNLLVHTKTRKGKRVVTKSKLH